MAAVPSKVLAAHILEQLSIYGDKIIQLFVYHSYPCPSQGDCSSTPWLGGACPSATAPTHTSPRFYFFRRCSSLGANMQKSMLAFFLAHFLAWRSVYLRYRYGTHFSKILLFRRCSSWGQTCKRACLPFSRPTLWLGEACTSAIATAHTSPRFYFFRRCSSWGQTCKRACLPFS